MTANWDTFNVWGIAVSLIAGLFLGLVYFGGLWLTVRRLVQWQRPALVFMLSFLARMSVSLAGLLMLARAGWPYLAAGVVGMLVTRMVLTNRLGPAHALPRGE